MSNQEHIEDEINLREYIKVIWKRKTIILTIFFVAVITTAIVSFLMPKVYRVSMIIEPASLGIGEGGNTLYLTPIGNIKAIIEEGAFNLKIIKALNLEPEKTILDFDVSHPKNSEVIKISTEQEEKQRDLGLAILNQLANELSNHFKEIIESKKNNIEKQISLISNNIIAKNNEIKLQEKMLNISEEREIELLDEIKETKSNTERLLAQREALLDNKGEIDDISSLLYTNTIQQNISYFSELQNELTGLKEKKENIRTQTKNIKKEIDNLKINIEKLNLIKDSIYNIRLIQKPEISISPIKPKKKQNVAISGVVGLMLGIFIAFSQEFWAKGRNVEEK